MIKISFTNLFYILKKSVFFPYNLLKAGLLIIFGWITVLLFYFYSVLSNYRVLIICILFNRKEINNIGPTPNTLNICHHVLMER